MDRTWLSAHCLRSHTIVALLLVLLALLTVPLAVSAATTASINDITVSPTEPNPGETVRFTPLVQNPETSDEAIDINAIAIRAAGDGVNELDRVDSLGTLSPGSSLEVTLTAEFGSPGMKSVRVLLYAHPVGNPAESITVEYPATFNVRDTHPQIDIKTDDPTTGVISNGSVTLVNGLTTEITNVEVTVDGTDTTMIDGRSVIATLAPGQSTEIPIEFRPEAAGERELTATVDYTVDGTTRRTMTRSSTVQADPLDDDIRLDVVGSTTGSGRPLTVAVSNFGNHPAENVAVSASSDEATFDEALISSLPAGETRTVELDATLEQPSATATVSADYQIGALDSATSTTETIEANSGAVTLTGLDTSRDDGRLRISGSVSNTGTTDIDSVVIRVRDTGDVDPAFPNKEYFIGTVPASDFVSFDLYARLGPETSTLPLEVTYLIDGEDFRQAFDIDISRTQLTPAAPENSGTDGGGVSGALAIAVGSLCMITVGGIMALGWRRANNADS